MTTVTHSSLARETVNYAAECLRAGERALALEVIQCEASGLKPEHQQDIDQIIKGLGEQASPRDLNLAEDRMIGVLQP
jgi:diadenosine tetraphosphatase ApaH/serine/threonine PP2A family protein phosphatase